MPPFRWVGYEGDAGHGCGNHLHLSWNHSAVAQFELAEWVEVFPVGPEEGERKLRGKRPKAPKAPPVSEGPQGPMVHAPDLTRAEWQSKVTDPEIAQVIANGRNRMPKFDFPPEVVAGLVSRIRSIKGR